MNKKIVLYYLGLLLLASCTGMNNIIEEYLDAGETVYIGKVDSLKAYAGKERIRFSWMVGVDPRIDACKIYWNNHRDSVIIPIDNSKITDGMYEATIPVEEGNHVFNLYHTGSGPQSIKKEIAANVYGEFYQSNLSPRSIRSMLASQQQIVITWGDAKAALYTSLTYKNKEGHEKTLTVLPADQTTTINDYVCNGTFSTTSFFLPEETAIDTFNIVSSEQFPAYYELSRAGWTTRADTETSLFPSSNVLDGKTGSLWHSAWDPEKTFPHELIIDMQNKKHINKIYILRDYTRCHLKKACILVSNDQSKWTEAGTVEFENNKTNTGSYLELKQGIESRYLKLYMTESYRGALVDVAEVYVYGSEIQ